MTILLTLVGVLVFIVSLFTAGFKTAWKRLATLAITGLIIDCLIITFATAIVYCYH